jgi:enoyl-CoA hydratase/carnithine racemase
MMELALLPWRSIMEPHGAEAMERHPHGEVRTDVVDNRVLVITVDRAEKRNAFTPKILGELAAALTRLDDDPELFVGALTFAGGHTTAGLDMPLFFGGAEGERGDETGSSPGEGQQPVDPVGLRRRLTKPLVTAVQGITFTVGIEIALAGDIIVAASDARFCQLEPRRGLAPLGGATIRYVQRAGWGNAMYHLLRADEFDAAEAYRIGLVQEVVEPGRQVERALELARDLLRCSPLALRHTISNARLALEQGEPAAVAAIPAMAATLQASNDFAEGISSFVERRQATFSGR